MPYYENNETTPARIYLQPLAAPSILGLYALAGSTFMLAAHAAGWFGRPGITAVYLWPFVSMLGIAQFLAGMWAFKARDGLATALHGVWGSFYIAFGVLMVEFLNGRLPVPGGAFPEAGFYFIVLAAISWMLAWAAIGESVLMTLTCAFLAAGSTIEAIAWMTGIQGGLQLAGGWVFVAASFCAWYTASALTLKESFGRTVLGIGKLGRAKEAPVVETGTGEPGVVRGQSMPLMPQPEASH